jgi:hypothetical protein
MNNLKTLWKYRGIGIGTDLKRPYLTFGIIKINYELIRNMTAKGTLTYVLLKYYWYLQVRKKIKLPVEYIKKFIDNWKRLCIIEVHFLFCLFNKSMKYSQFIVSPNSKFRINFYYLNSINNEYCCYFWYFVSLKNLIRIFLQNCIIPPWERNKYKWGKKIIDTSCADQKKNATNTPFLHEKNIIQNMGSADRLCSLLLQP